MGFFKKIGSGFKKATKSVGSLARRNIKSAVKDAGTAVNFARNSGLIRAALNFVPGGGIANALLDATGAPDPGFDQASPVQFEQLEPIFGDASQHIIQNQNLLGQDRDMKGAAQLIGDLRSVMPVPSGVKAPQSAAINPTLLPSFMTKAKIWVKENTPLAIGIGAGLLAIPVAIVLWVKSKGKSKRRPRRR